MEAKTLLAPLFAGALVIGLSGIAQADPIYYDLGAGAGSGVDGHTDRDGAIDPDQVTEVFDQLSVFANTTTTQFDDNGNGVLDDGESFSDNGNLHVTGLVPGGAGDNEALNNLNGYQMTAAWTGLTGTSSALSVDPNDATQFVASIKYDKVGNTTFHFYVDDTNTCPPESGCANPAGGGRTNFNYGATVGSGDDTNFTDGVLVLSVLITGGSGTNTFDSNGVFISGSSVLEGEVTFALNDFWFFDDGDLDFNDLVGANVQIAAAIDQNTDNVVVRPGACGDADPTTICSPGGVLFDVDSDHDGSVDFTLVPEPGSLMLFGLGFLALGGIGLATRRQRYQA